MAHPAPPVLTVVQQRPGKPPQGDITMRATTCPPTLTRIDRTPQGCSPQGRTPRAAAIPLAILLLAAGCEAPKPATFYLAPEAAGRHDTTLLVTAVRNDTGKPVPQPILDRTGARLASRLGERGLTVMHEPPAGAGDYLVIDPHMVRYEAGDAFGRWLGFGAGAAICALRVEAADGRTGQHLGDGAVTQSIQGGGLYSLGAGDYIVDRCADALAAGIADRLAPPIPAPSGATTPAKATSP